MPTLTKRVQKKCAYIAFRRLLVFVSLYARYMLVRGIIGIIIFGVLFCLHFWTQLGNLMVRRCGEDTPVAFQKCHLGTFFVYYVSK